MPIQTLGEPQKFLKWEDIPKSIQSAWLPSELYISIIDYALEEVRYPHLYCRVENITQFSTRMIYPAQFLNSFYIAAWLKIRSVCRIWRCLAGDLPFCQIKYGSVDIGDTNNTLKHVPGILLEHDLSKLLGSLASKPATSPLRIIFSCWDVSSSLDILTENPTLFSNLQCLSISQTNRDFWQAIQDGYPQLVSLTVIDNLQACQGHYILRGLEFLDTTVWSTFGLTCPSLKHLFLRSGNHSNFASMTQFIVDHGHQLESFDLVDEGRFTIDPTVFWQLLPNLKMLGKPLRMIPTPPPNHPLRHLRLNSPSRLDIPIHQLRSILDGFPNITHLHLWFDWHNIQKTDQLVDFLVKRNITVIDITPTDKPIGTFRYSMDALKEAFVPKLGWLFLQ